MHGSPLTNGRVAVARFTETAVSTPSNILETCVHVRDGGSSGTIAMPASFWEELAASLHPQLDHGRLMSAFTFAEPWATWERHPDGEELVMLLAGAATVVIQEAGQERCVHLGVPGDYVLVPRNAWHTARATAATTLLFLTPGAGTEHKPVDV